jgi:ATP-dependent Zn protease
VSVSVESAVAPVPNLAQQGGGVSLKHEGITERTKGQFLDRIAVSLGGAVAEEIVLGERSAGAGGRSGSDLHAATLLALACEASYGLGAGLAYLSSEDEEELIGLLRLDRLLHARVEKLLDEQNTRAKRILEEHREHVEQIADALLVNGTLCAEEIRELMARQPRRVVVGVPERSEGTSAP